LEVETVAVAVLSKHRLLWLEYRVNCCEVDEIVVTAVLFCIAVVPVALSEVEGDTTVGEFVNCLAVLGSLLVPVQRLVWCLCLQLQHRFFDWHCELL